MRAHQSGTALLSVLLLASIMAVLAMTMLDDIRFGVRRAANAQAMAQAQRFALGTEALARARIGQLAKGNDDPVQWSGKPLVFPIEHGHIRARLHDASTCFNLNSVVEGAPEQWRRRELGVRQYVALLQALEFPAAQAQALADALADWIDTDSQRASLGAEDASYVATALAYRTSATLLAEVSELRAIRGYEDHVYARLRPHVCALPSAELSPVNVNALRDGDGPVLSMLTIGAVVNGDAERIIASRPVGGWGDATAFWAHPALSKAVVPNEVYDQVTQHSRWFALQSDVEYSGAQVVLSALLQLDDSGRAHLRARRWTPEE